jgi:large subunit ribosomal protein L16
MPKNIKWKKPHKPAVKPFQANDWKYKGEAYKGNKPHFGKYALQIREEAWIRAENIEASRRMMVRTLRKRGGKHWIRVFPQSGLTKRTAESRMGAGKGSIDSWVMAVRPGFILFEIDGTDEFTARGALGKIQRYLPFKTKFIVSEKPSYFELGLAGSLVKKQKHIPKEFRKDS